MRAKLLNNIVLCYKGMRANMRLKTVIAVLLGCFIGFLIFGLLKGEYVWKYLIAALIGGPLGYFTVLTFVKNNRRKSTL